MSKSIKLQHPTEDKVKQIKTGGFNSLGLILGPLLYMAWGMWTKGLWLSVVAVLLLVVQDIVFEMVGLETGQSVLGFLVMLYSAFSINKDNYQHLLSRGWKPTEEKVESETINTKRNRRSLIILLIILLFFTALMFFLGG